MTFIQFLNHSQGETSVECYLINQNHHAGGGDNLCKATNTRGNFGQIADNHVTGSLMRR